MLDKQLEQMTAYHKQRTRALFAERARRRGESLCLYEPSPIQAKFHECNAKELLFQAGNQVGKTLSGFIEDVRAMTGQDPYNKYPKENGVMALIGLDAGHIGRVFHHYLFEPGRFRKIKDEETGEWRSWKPWNEYDAAYKEKSKDCPPLLEERFVKGGYKGIVWEDRGKRIFSSFYLNNGWKVMAFSSKGEPAAGFQADLIHIDEDIEDPNWYDEMIARLTIRKGKMRWTALPLAKNDKLINVHQRAQEEKDDENPSTVVLRATVHDNPYIDAQTREENIKRWRANGEDEYRKRALGELTIDSVLVYPTFDKYVHTAIKTEGHVSSVQKIITEADGNPPPNWCHYMSVDPGHQTCAVTFYAVPPPDVGDQVVLYDELYIKQCDAIQFANRVYEKAKNTFFEAFIIDAHGGRLREMGSGVLPRDRYSQALRERGIRSRQTGFGFLNGSDDIKGREGIVREWLRIRSDGTSRLIIIPYRVPNTIREMERFKKKRSARGYISDESDRSRDTHAVETLEYAAAHGLRYVKPPSNRVSSSWFDVVMEGRRMREEKRKAKGHGQRQNYINLGPTGS